MFNIHYMVKINFAVYEITPQAAEKYSKIFNKSQDVSIDFLIDSPELPKAKDKKIHQVYKKNNKQILELLLKKDIKTVLFFSHRIQDLAFATFLKKNFIKVIYLQHGYYEISSMKRTFGGVIRKLYRFKSIFLRVFSSKFNLNEWKKIIIPSILHWVMLVNYPKNFLNPYHHSFVFNEYWKDKHEEIYQIKKSKMTLIGSFDYKENFYVPDQIEAKDDLIYICQSLFEDGRITRSKLQNVFFSLQGVKKIKYHPRSNKEIYSSLNAKEIKQIPIGANVVGHYSSLLVAAKELGCKVQIIDIDGHEIPKSFKDELRRCKPDLSLLNNDPINVIFKKIHELGS